MSNVLLLGAGASFGSDTDDTPPLGTQLFDALCAFNPLGWGALPAQFAPKFRSDFEAAMLELGNAHPHSLPRLQRAMAAYFFDFRPRTSSLYVQLARRIRDTQWSGAICTLNYERLLELSILSAGLQPVIGSETRPGSALELCVPHGCCHIFCDGARGTANRVSFSAFGVNTNGRIVVVSNPLAHRQRIEQDAFPPVMSYFEPQKRTTAGASFITRQRERWHKLTAQAEKIVAVGIRVRSHDGHIWDPIARSPATVIYCSPTEAVEEFRTWASHARHQKRNIVAEGNFADKFESVCSELGI